MANRKYRKHTAEFKAEAVSLVLEHDKPKAQVSRSLGISPSMLERWIQKHEEEKDPVKSKQVSESKRVLELERELKRVTEERDILKKAAIFFAKEKS